MSESNPILSGTATPEGMKQRLEDARQQLIQAANVEDKEKENEEFLKRCVRSLRQSFESNIKQLESRKENFDSAYKQCQREHFILVRQQEKYDSCKRILEACQNNYNCSITTVEDEKIRIKQIEEKLLEQEKKNEIMKVAKLTPHERIIVENTKFYEKASIGGVKCSEFQKGNVPNTIVLPAPKFINGIEQLRSAESEK
jgi:hypothetical protein